MTDNQHHNHVLPLSVYLTIGTALLVRTVVTVWVASYDLGPLNLVVAMIIASVKGTLVALYFMHLRYDKPFNSVVLVSSIFFLALFLGLALLDTLHYRADLIPSYAPAIEQSAEPGAARGH